MKRMLKGRKIAYGRIIGILLAAVIVFAGIPYAVRLKKIYNREIIANIPDPEKYPVMGVDVSRYQGNIDWPVIASQNVTFAFIKATEGSSHQDPCFTENWNAVKNTNIYAGAYHFFSYESSGKTQAQNFIDTVGNLSDTNLPPVIDLEFYGDYSNSPLSRRETQKILNTLLETLEEYYHVKPIIYTTTKAYYHYLLGGGYDGIQTDHTEMFIDLNVYHSTYESFLEEFSLPETRQETLAYYETSEKENQT